MYCFSYTTPTHGLHYIRKHLFEKKTDKQTKMVAVFRGKRSEQKHVDVRASGDRDPCLDVQQENGFCLYMEDLFLKAQSLPSV